MTLMTPVTGTCLSGDTILRRYFLVLAAPLAHLKCTNLQLAASRQFAARIGANGSERVSSLERRFYRWSGLARPAAGGDYMGHKFWGWMGLFASIVAGAGVASAADMPVKAPPRVVPPAPVYLSDWAGFYIGVNGGGAFTEDKFSVDPALRNSKPSGGLVGGHAGYNWQYGNVVAGLETDVDGAFISKTFMPEAGVKLKDKTDELATARARLGYLVLPNLLVYGTAGAAWGHTEISKTTAAVNVTDGISQFGWAAGAGLEYKIWGPLIARAEYLHYDFENTSLVSPSLTGTVRESIDAVRGGLSYKF
jgi:opacity protein-like surface antigen